MPVTRVGAALEEGAGSLLQLAWLQAWPSLPPASPACPSLPLAAPAASRRVSLLGPCLPAVHRLDVGKQDGQEGQEIRLGLWIKGSGAPLT